MKQKRLLFKMHLFIYLFCLFTNLFIYLFIYLYFWVIFIQARSTSTYAGLNERSIALASKISCFQWKQEFCSRC